MAEQVLELEFPREENSSEDIDNRYSEVDRRTIIARNEQRIPRAYRGHYKKAVAGKSRKAAIRAHCLECVGWNSVEVRKCTSPGCPLYFFRIKG